MDSKTRIGPDRPRRAVGRADRSCREASEPIGYGAAREFSELQREVKRRAARQGDLSTLLEVRALTEQYRQTYNSIRPHSSLGYRSPAPETFLRANPRPVPAGLT